MGEEVPTEFHRVAARACARYDLPGRVEPTLLAAGHNYVFRVESAASRFVLRLQSAARMNGGTIAVLLPWLASASRASGVVVPEPVPLPDGSLHAEVRLPGEPGRWWCTLLRWVDGRPCPTASEFVEPTRLRAIGSTVARLHRHAESFLPPTLAGCRRKDTEWLTGPASALANGAARQLLREDDYAAFRSAGDRVARAMARRGESPAISGRSTRTSNRAIGCSTAESRDPSTLTSSGSGTSSSI